MKPALLVLFVTLLGCRGGSDDSDAGAPLLDAAPGIDAAPGVDAQACAAEISCPAPEGGNVSLCGRLFDIETSELVAATGVGTACNPGAPTADGPCSLTLKFYDPLAFAANPQGTATLDVDEVTIDDCGRFRATNVNRPFNGFMGVVTDNAPAGGAATHVTTIRAFPVEMDETRTLLRAPRTRQTTVDSWGTTRGGLDFAEKGATLFEYRHRGMLVLGVSVTAGGATKPDDTTYLGDGRALLINSNLGQHSGTGAEPAGCEWESELATSVPTAIWFAPRPAHVIGDPEEPCP